MDDFTAGNYADRWCYLSYQPKPLMREWGLVDAELLALLQEAEKAIAKLNKAFSIDENAHVIESFYELAAVYSCRLAGFEVTVDAYRNREKLANNSAFIKVNKYIQVLKSAPNSLNKLPFSARLVRELHRQLQTESASHSLSPGEYRTHQSWIGTSLQNAEYIPPVPSSIVELMSDWEVFANDDTLDIPILLKAALLHYQFEAIHPFMDANGRVGRLLIPVYLYHVGILNVPAFFLSKYFYAHKTEYIISQANVRVEGDMRDWVLFFLRGIIEIAESGCAEITK